MNIVQIEFDTERDAAQQFKDLAEVCRRNLIPISVMSNRDALQILINNMPLSTTQKIAVRIAEILREAHNYNFIFAVDETDKIPASKITASNLLKLLR